MLYSSALQPRLAGILLHQSVSACYLKGYQDLMLLLQMANCIFEDSPFKSCLIVLCGQKYGPLKPEIKVMTQTRCRYKDRSPSSQANSE